ncbi:MAG: hypothetical protein ACFFCZ_09640 [Promethearchaeota archaeon]
MKKNSLMIIFVVTVLVIPVEIGLGMAHKTSNQIIATGEPNHVISADLTTIKSSDITIPFIPDVFEYEINIVFLGIDKTRINEKTLLSGLPQWYAPMYTIPLIQTGNLDYDLNFTLSYNPIYLDSSAVSDYRVFLNANSREDRSPWFIQPEYATARYIPSSLVESYLTQNVLNTPIPTLFIIDTYSFDPVGHSPYYYNGTSNELDAELGGYTSNPVPFGSTYQITGGGANSRRLWLDLSAGPTEYQSHEIFTVGAVNESSVPPIWIYEGLPNAIEELTQDLTKYITSAVELRFLPSTGWAPLYPYEEVKFEILTADIDPSDFDFVSKLDMNYIIAEYQRVNPFVNWTYSIAEWDWESSGLKNVLNENNDSATHTLDVTKIRDYLDFSYAGLFNASSKEQLIIPIFLFFLPADYNFNPDWGAFTQAENGKFTYILCKLNLAAVDPSFSVGGFSLNEFTIDQGSSFDVPADLDFLNVSALPLGKYNEIIDISLTINTGSLNVYVLDEYNYQRYNQSLSFTDLLNHSLTNISPASGTVQATLPIHIYGLYHIIFEDNETTAPNFNITLIGSSDWSNGYTWKTMHEIGHALGLNHPHDGYSWENYNHSINNLEDYVRWWGYKSLAIRGDAYTYWLWDMTSSQINYASQDHTISVMDIDTLQRGFIPQYWQEAVRTITNITEMAVVRYTELPIEVYEPLVNALNYFNQSIEAYTKQTNADHYYKALEAVFELLADLDLTAIALANRITADEFQTLTTLFIGVAAIVIVLSVCSYLLIMRKQKRKNVSFS